MKRYLIRAGVGIVAITMAILLFPRPDTGGELTASAPVPEAVAVTEADPTPADLSPAVAEAPRRSAVEMRRTKSDAMAAAAERLAAPEAEAARELGSAIGAARFTLRAMKTPGALALSNGLVPGQQQLAAIRRAPDAESFADALNSIDTALEAIRTSEYADNPDVAASIARYDATRSDL